MRKSIIMANFMLSITFASEDLVGQLIMSDDTKSVEDLNIDHIIKKIEKVEEIIQEIEKQRRKIIANKDSENQKKPNNVESQSEVKPNNVELESHNDFYKKKNSDIQELQNLVKKRSSEIEELNSQKSIVEKENLASKLEETEKKLENLENLEKDPNDSEEDIQGSTNDLKKHLELIKITLEKEQNNEKNKPEVSNLTNNDQSATIDIQKELLIIAKETDGGVGFKAANLTLLKKACEIFKKKNNTGFEFKVPEFLGIPSNFIIKTINEIFNVDLQKNFTTLNNDPEKFKEYLENKFNNKNEHEKIIKKIDEFLNGKLMKFFEDHKDKKFMIRSTGNEDTKEIANAGGNETIPNVEPNTEKVWKAIKDVLLSYFGKKSQAQQNLGKKDLSKPTELFMPVLIQVMAGEEYENENIEKIPTSGVLFSEDPESHIENKFSGITKISFTYGHCEAVVNGLLPVDEVTIASNNIIVPTFTRKIKRLIPSKDGGLIDIKNPLEIQKKPSLNKEKILALKTFGDFLEKEFYKYQVDVEFSVTGNTINIVQCRPITYNKTDKKPSYYVLDKTKDINTYSVKGKVIGTGHKSIIEIAKSNIIIAKTLGDALSIYLKLKDDKNKHLDISCVLTEEMAPTTSHEATVMRGVSMPVICLDEDKIKMIKNFQNDHKMIISPQQGLVIHNIDHFNALNLEKKEGLSNYPINDLSTDVEWLGIENLKTEKNYTHQISSEEGNELLKLHEYYFEGKKDFDKENQNYFLLNRAIELLSIDAVKFNKNVTKEDILLKDHKGLSSDMIQLMKLSDCAQNDDVKNTWETFLSDLDQIGGSNIKIKQKFFKMVYVLNEMKIFPLWLNSIFYHETFEKYEKLKTVDQNKKEKLKKIMLWGIIDALDKEFDAEKLKQVCDLRLEIDSWNQNAFEDPKNFEKNFKNLKKLLENVSYKKLSEIFNDTYQTKAGHSLTTFVWLQCFNDLIDKVDISIKSLTGSTHYIKDDWDVNKKESQHNQVSNFKKLLELNYEFLTSIYKISEGKDDIKKLEELKNQFPKAFSDIESDIKKAMNATPDFNVMNAISDNLYGNQYSAEDWFTTIHQKLLLCLSKLKIKYESNVQESAVIKKFSEEINNQKDKEIYTGNNFKPTLKNREFSSQGMTIEYNVPLRSHSSVVKFEYNKNISKITLNIFGDNEFGRWNRVQLWAQKNDPKLLLKKASCTKNGVSIVWEIPNNKYTNIDFNPYVTFIREKLLNLTFLYSGGTFNNNPKDKIYNEFKTLFEKLDKICNHINVFWGVYDEKLTDAIASYTPDTINQLDIESLKKQKIIEGKKS